MEAAEAVRRRAERLGEPVSVAYLDVDGFKTVNDRYGHPAGDLLLREVGRRIAETVREIDLACRKSGDEFSVVLPNTDLTAARRVAIRLRDVLNGVDVRWLRHVFQTSVSLGVGQYDGESTAARFVTEVDGRLYDAKQANRPAPSCP